MAQQSHFANVVQSSNNETSDAAAMFRTVMARSTLTCRNATRPCRRGDRMIGLLAAVHESGSGPSRHSGRCSTSVAFGAKRTLPDYIRCISSPLMCHAAARRRRARQCDAVPKANGSVAARRHDSARVRQRHAAGLRYGARDSREPSDSRCDHSVCRAARTASRCLSKR